MTEPLKCSFVGLGRIASLLEDDEKREKPCTHAGAVDANPDCEISGGCDLVEERRKLFSGRWGCPVFEDLPEMLEKTDPDILFIATHPDTHLDITEKAITRGVRVIVCEKPLADTLKKARKIASYHSKNLAKIMTNHERRYSADYVRARGLIKEKEYGELLSINSFLYMGKNKRLKDVMWHDGTHMADIIMFLAGGVLKKKKISGSLRKKTGTAFISAEIKPDKKGRNIPVMFQCGAGRDHLLFSLELSFESGMIRIGNGIYEEWKSVESSFYEGFKSPEKVPVAPFGKTGYFMNMVADAVKAAREPYYEPVSTALDGCRAVEFLASL